MPEAGAWPTLPQDVVKQDVPASSLDRRAPGRLPHLRHSQGQFMGSPQQPVVVIYSLQKTSGWRRFRAEDFNAEILAPGIGGERGWDHGSNIGSIIGSYLI